LSNTDDAGVTRRRFLGLTGVWSGSLAAGRLRSTPVSNVPMSTPASIVQQFINRLDRRPPFAFSYGGLTSATLLATWRRIHQRKRLDAQRTEHTFTWTDPKTRLVVRCVLVEYHDFPTVDWTVYVQNSGSRRSPPLSALMALDTTFEASRTAAVVLHSFDGSSASPADYQPHAVPLAAGDRRLFWCQGGRPTNGTLPYFNIDWGGHGVIAVVGWPGQWTTQIERDASSGVRVQAAMSSADPAQGPVLDIRLAQLANLWLEPGEDIRTPLIALQFWQSASWIDAQNVWRRWMIAHNLPRLPDNPPVPICPTGATDGYFPGLIDTAADEFLFLDRYAAERTTANRGGMFDHWWMDAGWYALPAGATDWTGVGTWQPDPRRFPHGLRPITDRARAQGMKSVVWHEPERVQSGTWLFTHHPEWLLTSDSAGDTRLLNLGNPQAWRWVVEHFDQLIRTQGVDVYRQDFNMDPLDYWNAADPPGRRGITQIRHVMGYLAFWDELRRRHPQLLIDSCASGGRRNDLETLRRAVPLLRSDYQFEPTGQQCHTYGLSFWLPYYGTGVGPQSTNGGAYGSGMYVMRSSFAPCYASSLDVRSAPAAAWELMRRMTREWREIADNLLGDYYPLTDYSIDTAVWMAWQFHRPEVGEGVVLAFRRADSPDTAAKFLLHGLDPGTSYELRNLDAPGTTRAMGRDLMRLGIRVRFADRPAAATIAYRRSTS
jgi:alpha-galactosidase